MAYESELSDRALFRVPGMTSPRERAFVKFLARRRLRGIGDVVELGPFLGGLTVALLRGLSQSGKVAPRVRVYDQFRVDGFMEDTLNKLHAAGQISRSYRVGESFREEFERQIEGLKPQPKVIEGSLASEVSREGKIEFLVVDAMKDLPTCISIAKNFYADLVAGGMVLHQDFAHYWASWIHLLHHHLGDSFEFEYHVPMTSSVLYRCIRPPTREEIDQFNEALCSDSQFIDAAFASSLSQVTDGMSSDVQAAHVMAYVHAGRHYKAAEWFARYTDDGSNVQREMAMVRIRIQED
jgi:hypothetical protein